MKDGDYEYSWKNRGELDHKILSECAELFSNHYGVWGNASPRRGKRIRLSADCLSEFTPGDSWVVLARCNGQLAGYAFGMRADVPSFGIINWVTQLVVHAEHRRRGVAKWLLFTFWAFSDHAAWGLVTSNPYAVRALESITHRRCDPTIIHARKTQLDTVGKMIPYTADRDTDFNGRSVIDTGFQISHRHLPQKLKDVTRLDAPWLLGQIKEGEEWLAFTFKTQPQEPLNAEELKAMLKQSKRTAQWAYERMQLGIMQSWMSHTNFEVEFAIRELKLAPRARVLDLGCGPGRHAVTLAERGFDVVGIDFVECRVHQASEHVREKGIMNAKFICDDARTIDAGIGTFDAAICLYDVIGTFHEQEENQKLLDNLVRHLAPGGRALVSVLNLELTENIATNRASIEDDPGALQTLKPSVVMQTTGQIFNPEYFLIDPKTKIVYRKEQFDNDGKPPGELIVPDRRYTRTDIAEMTSRAGARLLWAKPVALGKWDQELAGTDERAKEILFLIERG